MAGVFLFNISFSKKCSVDVNIKTTKNFIGSRETCISIALCEVLHID